MPSETKKGKNKIRKLPQPSKNVHLKDSGYGVKKSTSARRKALKKASKSQSSLSVLKRLNLIRNLSREGSDNKKRLSEDVEYMKRLYKREKSGRK
jgi:hypothetical protein